MEERTDVKTFVCKKCGKEFSITFREMGFFIGQGLRVPTKCIACRVAERDKRGNKLILTDDLIGKRIVRAKPNFRDDRSFMREPGVAFLGVDDGKICYCYLDCAIRERGRIEVLDREWNDGNWKIAEKVVE